MSFSFPITLPDEGYDSARLIPEFVTGVSRSEWTLQEQIFEHQGQAWRAEVAYPPKLRADAEPLLAALLSLGGRKGSFLFGDPLAASPRGNPLGTPLVDGAGQDGSELATRGWTPSATGLLLAGDYIQIGSGESQRLYKVLADADADGAGDATLDIFPRLRDLPADGTAIVTSGCKGAFRLESDERPWDESLAGFYAIAFAAIEAQ